MKTTTSTHKKTKIIGRETIVITGTGQMIEADIVETEERDFNFHKIWLGHIVQTLDIIGNKKIKVVNYVMQNRNNDNLFIKSQKEIEKDLKISETTINETFKALQEGDFLTMVQRGVYRINPNVIFKGSIKNRMNILLMYKDEQSKNYGENEESEYTQEELINQQIKNLQEQLKELQKEKIKSSKTK